MFQKLKSGLSISSEDIHLLPSIVFTIDIRIITILLSLHAG